jgi:hypothetical protein
VRSGSAPAWQRARLLGVQASGQGAAQQGRQAAGQANRGCASKQQAGQANRSHSNWNRWVLVAAAMMLQHFLLN